MAQLRAKQIKLASQDDLLIGGANGNGTVLSKGTAGQVLKVLTGGAIGYELVKAADTTFDKGSTTLTATTVEAAIQELAGLAGDGTQGVQDELDATQNSVGLNADGSYTQVAGSTFLGSATTVKGSLAALDTALAAVKTTADAAATDADLTALQETITGDIDALESRVTTNEGAIADIEGTLVLVDSELNAIEATIGSKTDGSPNFYANGNYIVAGSAEVPEDATDPENVIPAIPAVTPDNHTVAIGKLDAALAAAASDLADEQDTRQSDDNAIKTGAGLETTGAYAADGTTNYLTAATSLKDADKKLDAQIKSVADAVANLEAGAVDGIQAELDTTQASIGLDANGALVAFAAGGHAEGQTTFKAAVEAIDAALVDAESDIAALQTQVTGLANLGALRFIGPINGGETAAGLAARGDTAGAVYRIAIAGATDFAETGIEVNVGDFIVKTEDAENPWVKFDNTDPTVVGGASITVTGDAHAGYTVAVVSEDITSTTDAITITGGTGAALADVGLTFVPGNVAFETLGNVGAPEAGKFLRWNGTAIEYVTAAQLGATVHAEEDFAPTTTANYAATLANAPVGDVAVFINGVKLKKAGFTVAGSTVTLVDSANGYGVEAGDTLSISYNRAA